MGKIQENLVLTDEFTAAFTRFLTLGESAVGATERINNSINMMGQSSNTIAAAGFNTWIRRSRNSAEKSRNRELPFRHWETRPTVLVEKVLTR